MTAPIQFFLAIAVFASTISFSAKATEFPTFQGEYCTEVAKQPIKPAERFLALIQCNRSENQFKEQLQKHWFLVTDDDMKFCMKSKGTMNEIKSYLQLMGCLSDIVGSKCYSGKLTCRGKTL
ncbi:MULTISPECIES: hypothetical protein [unclassified Rhizobium]|uniref:hypothetical protein n=1 Tax=unclassified Rhizobium TaxID=2613769 RepID=UPI001C82ED6B|nr:MULTISPECIES: hypothetical protein [unclassified Rhizobium]MBX5163600.1 hypothetical protein [Rhizobium sp. NZLR4b]MBX5208689.1 hypothetical protein [Rhizobium sp. NZLR11]